MASFPYSVKKKKNLCWACLLEIVLSNQFECGKNMVLPSAEI